MNRLTLEPIGTPGDARYFVNVERHTWAFKVMNDTGVTIRAGKGSDINRVTVMVERYWAFEGIAGLDRAAASRQLERVLDDERLGSVIVASNGETLVGYLITVYVFSLEHLGLTAEIDEFYVEPEHRSSGAGSLMLAAAERSARDAGCSNISLQLGEHNRRARDMYSRHGYTPRRGYALLEKRLEVDR